MKDKTLLIIPAFNEEFVMGRAVDLALECKRQRIVDDFIVINDHSDDRTAEVAQLRGAEVKNSFFRKNGKGECYLTALAHCVRRRATILAMLDADIMQASPQQVREMIDELKCNPAAKMAVHPVNEDYVSKDEHDICQRLSGARAIRVNAALGLLFNRNFLRACMGFGLELALNKWLSIKHGKEAVVFMPEGKYAPLQMRKHLRRPDVFRRQMEDIRKATIILSQRRPRFAG